ncbi:uncharacterized protein JCM15063_005432 [Sporobolomyces koalae]|uniref:uncharacterized protein n=1 Tax=Sporobolomyces koalae TaxID=500713 RepID=UPI00316B2AB6
MASPPSTSTGSAVAVDIETIEAAKENIVPLNSGRSASQLASVLGSTSTSTRSGLGLKLDQEHSRFRTQIAAVQSYEQTGHWTDGQDGLTLDQVAQLAEDPLDISHQYVRFIIANYPSGANAQNKLVPVLEETTRRFLGDERYTNDPRYFRLWAHYAKNMESPIECYRFLFAKGVGEKLAALYEEFAKVLETVGKRQQADQVYQLGINRKVTPLDRLKRSYLDFQARMLVAPPLPPSPPREPQDRAAAVRPILAASSARPVSGGTGVGPKGNGSMFAVFKDDSAAAQTLAQQEEGTRAEWDDFGTVKSRKRENDQDKKEWSGETLSQQPSAIAPALGGFKLEVYRDETATSTPNPNSLLEHHHPTTEAFAARSNRTPSEAEQLRQNPFKNYSAADVDLLTRDPLEGLEVLPPSTSTVKKSSTKKSSSSSSTGDKKKTSSRSKTSSSSSSTTSAAAADKASASTEPKPQQISFKLERLRDPQHPDQWISFEEERVHRRRAKYIVQDVDTWNGWEWREKWEQEVKSTGQTTYIIDQETGWPVVQDRDGAPLYDFLRPVPEPSEEPQQQAPASPRSEQGADESAYPPLDPHRPPSPTMNTRAANAMIDDLFAKTLDFTRFNPRDDPSGANDAQEEPSTDDDSDEDDDENGGDYPGGLLAAGSQFSTQQASQASSVGDEPFVPFSQTGSMMGDDSSFFGSQEQPAGSSSYAPVQPYGQGLLALNEEEEDDDENDENSEPRVTRMQLFRDSTTSTDSMPTSGGFRPVTKSARAPLGAKPVGGTPAPAPRPAPAFSVFQDVSREQIYEAQDEDEEPEESRHADLSDGYAMGRREPGIPNRYAPFVDNMTPITERTFEITTAMNPLSSSQRSSTASTRRSSAYAAPVVEDDEPSTEEDDDDEDEPDIGDQAFVASYATDGVDPSQQDDDDSSSDSSSDSSDEEGDVGGVDLLQQPQPQMLSPVQHDLARLSLGPQNSFDVSPNSSLPEGFTINGNQSGMTTGMVVTDVTIRPVDPYNLDLLRSQLAQLSTPITQHENVVNLSTHTAGKLAELQKTAKKRANSKTKDRTGTFDDAWELELDGEVFSVREKLGEGSFGAVFRIAFSSDDDNNDGQDSDASFDMDGTELFLAVKVERPTNFWEFYVLDQMQARLDDRTIASIVAPHRLYAYADESYLLLDLCDRGSLLNAVNKAQEYRIAPPGASTTGVDELLAMFFVIELLRTLEAFHTAGFIHGDLKIDNCLLRFEDVEGGGPAWQSGYDPSGAHGWGQKGLKVIDYGRTIDLAMYEPGQQFSSNLKTDHFDCIEMRESRPWTFEPDYHGVASIAYCLLFGHYMETEATQASSAGGLSKRMPKQAFRRYHQVDLWTKLFDMLLNPRQVKGTVPITDELRAVRNEMEAWLAANCNKNGKSLKSLLSKL